jgi:predicted outer membrane repeat protein
VTIAKGNAGGIVNVGTLTVANSAIVNNTGAPHGFSHVSVGGGIYNDLSGTLTVDESTVSGNSAAFGGGIDSEGPLAVSGSTVSSNSAGISGGGIYSLDILTMSGSAVSGNTAAALGGGIVVDFNLTASNTISSSALAGNAAGLDGGGIYAAGALTISGSTFSGNTAERGSGIFNPSAAFPKLLTVSGCAFTGNSATDGGGMYYEGAATVRDSLFSGNSACLGGCIYNYLDRSGFGVTIGTLDVRGSTFTGNTASDSGGGIYNLGTATVQESTLSANTAGSDGGGIFNGASATLAVKDSTVNGNSAPNGSDLFTFGTVTFDDRQHCRRDRHLTRDNARVGRLFSGPGYTVLRTCITERLRRIRGSAQYRPRRGEPACDLLLADCQRQLEDHARRQHDLDLRFRDERHRHERRRRGSRLRSSSEAELPLPVSECGLAQIALLAECGNGLIRLVPLREHRSPVPFPVRIATRHDGLPPTKKATSLPRPTRRRFAGRLRCIVPSGGGPSESTSRKNLRPSSSCR